METLVNDEDIDGFLGEERHVNFWFAMAHRYGVLLVDKQNAVTKMTGVDCESVFQQITPDHEAYLMFELANNHEGWARRLQLSKDDAEYKKHAGKWTTNKDPGKESSVRYANCSGWSVAGTMFYDKARVFFQKVRTDDRFRYYESKAKTWHFVQVLKPAAEKKSKKKKQRLEAQMEATAADYSEMF